MFCNLNSSKIFTCLLGKLRTEFISRMEKSTCPRLSDTTFFACWKSGREVKIMSALWLLIIPQKPLSRCSIITSAPAHVLCINKGVILIGSLSYFSWIKFLVWKIKKRLIPASSDAWVPGVILTSTYFKNTVNDDANLPVITDNNNLLEKWQHPRTDNKDWIIIQSNLTVRTLIITDSLLTFLDQFRFLGNSPPTPPLSQHYHSILT